MSDPSGPRIDPQALHRAQVSVTAFEIMKWALAGDRDAINRCLGKLMAEQGMTGMLHLTRALASLALEIRTDLRHHLPALIADLDAHDPRVVLSGLITFRDHRGAARPLDDDDAVMLSSALRFVYACSRRGDHLGVVAQFEVSLAHGMPGIADLFSGLTMLLLAILHQMPDEYRKALMDFRPDTQNVIDKYTELCRETARAATSAATTGQAGTEQTGTVFTIPDGLKSKILAAAVGPDPKQSAMNVSRLVVPVLLLHGQAALLAVCQTFACALADLLGMPSGPSRDPSRVISTMLVDTDGEPIATADVTDPELLARIRGYHFLTCYLNQDLPRQLELLRRDEDDGAMVCNGLSVLYREHHQLAEQARSADAASGPNR